MKQVTGKVISNTELMPGYHLLKLETPYIPDKAKPGQFVTISCGEKLTLRRPFSIHQVDSSGQISILFAIAGSGTSWLAKRNPEEKINLLGPLGNGFSVRPESKNLLLVAGGMGIAPLLFLAQKTSKSGKEVRLLIGARTKEHLYPFRPVTDKVVVIVTTEDGSQGVKGKVTDILTQYIDWPDQVFACGPLEMYRTVAEQMHKLHNNKSVQVSLEVTMGCGIGGCLGCSIRTKNGMKRVCLDGPTFDLDEVILEEVRI